MPVKGPAPAPAPVYNWTGWYAGVNAGASFGSVKTDFNGARLFADHEPIDPGFGFSDRTYPNGFIGGGQIGYNWQYSPLIVVGLEADFQGALEKDTTNNLTHNFVFLNGPNGNISSCFEDCTRLTSYTTQIDWFGTVRARIGYVWGNGEVMSYLTGGLAYGRVKINGTHTVSGEAFSVAVPGEPDFTFSATQTFSHSQVNTGWVVGYGTEGKLATPGWTWRVEGFWMDLGTLDAAGVISGTHIVCHQKCELPNLTSGQVTTHSHFTDGILRGGLSYKFY